MSSYNLRLLRFDSLDALAAEVASIESFGPEAVARVTSKAAHQILRLHRLDPHTAMLLKQELLALGGDALISPAVYLGGGDAPSDALVFASLRQLRELAARLQRIPLPALETLARELAQALEALNGPQGSLALGATTLAWGSRTYVMGIVNVTPDSFSGDGLVGEENLVTAALAQARRFAQEGADILDVGGESTRPGAQPVGRAEELARVVPVVRALAHELALPISVDSYHAEVVAAALDAGACMVNDVWGLRSPEGGWNEELARLVAARGVPIVIMHNRRAQASMGALGGFYAEVAYADLMDTIVGELRLQVDYALGHGIARERIVVDPGVGFGKTPAQNLVLLRRLGELRSLGLPVLVGASRKSFIGLALDLPPEARDEGTAAVTALAVQARADIVRVHNVLLNARVARMCDAILRATG
jgi:dihydropteroate synthase